MIAFAHLLVAALAAIASWAQPAPPHHDTTILWLHGGGWEGVAPAEFNWTADALEDAGYHVVIGRYRFTTEASHPAQVHDVHAWIEAAAETSDHVIVVGVSSGGHLASLAGTSWNSPTLNPGAQVRPDAVINLAGPLDPYQWGQDIAFRFPQTPPSVDRLLGGADPRSVMPATYADPADPPQVVVYANDDPIVPWSTQQSAAAELFDRVPVDVRVVDGGHALHGLDVVELVKEVTS